MKIKNIVLSFVFGGLTLSCTNDFDEINTNPNTIEKLTPGYQFGYIQLKYSGGGHEEWRGNLIMTGPLSGVTTCGYRTGQGFGAADDYSTAKWSVIYQDAVKNGEDLLRVMNSNPDVQVWESRIAQTDIMMQFIYQRMTDLYGDIPYSEAGKGFESNIFYPKYDSQEFIYKSMVTKLRQSRDLLLSSTSTSFNEKEDVIYGHLDNQSRKRAWARLANSLLLRIGMRASSADEAWAKEVVEEAAGHSAGLIDAFDSNNSAIIKHSMDGGPWGIHENGTGSAINGKTGGFAHAYLGDEYLRIAQQRKDPRLFFEGCQIVYKNGEYLPYTDQTYFNPFEEANRPGESWKPVTFLPGRGGADNSFAMRGMMVVNGTQVFADFYIDGGKLGSTQTVNKDNAETKYSYVYNAEYVQYRTLCGINPQTVGSRTAPTIVFGADETYYILAEAAAKGWNVTGTANDLLKKAVSLSMDKYPAFYKGDGSPYIYMEKYLKTIGEVPAGSIVSEGELKNKYVQLKEDYLASLGEATVESIQLERWKSLFLNGYEAFALWNRTELAVTPVGIPYGKNIEVPKYTWNQVQTITPATPVAAGEFSSVPFHNGGSTAGVRPRRLDYPNSERMNNSSNLNNAIEAQKLFGNDGSHFISNKMWISR